MKYVLTLVAIFCLASIARAQDTSAQQAQALIDKGLEFLRSQQKPDGGWNAEQEPPGITALVLKAFVQDSKYPSSTDFVAKGFDKLLSYQIDGGGIYKDAQANYNTAVAISALAASKDPKFKPTIDQAIAYIKTLQWGTESAVGPQGETVKDESHQWYGGWGYGRNARPDGSNMQMALDALHDAGLQPNDPAYQRALKFISRMQNYSETNDQPWAGNDGGFIYTPARNGESFAGEYTTPEGKRMLRSYGSLTYAGLKSMIYAGLSKDDPRVKASWNWISSNWNLDENPGMRQNSPEVSQNGVYYYYHTLARALNAYDEPIITDPQGNKHDWRKELIAKLAQLQKPDGSWTGAERWMEGNPVLVTSYVVLALQEAQQDLREHP